MLALLGAIHVKETGSLVLLSCHLSDSKIDRKKEHSTKNPLNSFPFIAKSLVQPQLHHNMLPVDANPMTLDPSIAMKLSASNDDELHGGQSKEAPQQQQQDAGQDAQITVASDKGKETSAQDHDVGTTPHDKLKQQEGLAIDINKALQHDDSFVDNPSAYNRKSSPHCLSLEIKKREMEIDAQMLELEERRLRWTKASRKKDRELEKMQLENDRMKLENKRMWVQLKLKEREVGVKSKRV